jgi:hypothetical protein
LTILSGRVQKPRCRIGKPQGGRGRVKGRVKDGAIQMMNMGVVEKVVDKTTGGKGLLRVGTLEVTGTHGKDETVPYTTHNPNMEQFVLSPLSLHLPLTRLKILSRWHGMKLYPYGIHP